MLAHPRVLRPVNVSGSVGRGLLTLRRGPDTLTVVNLLSPNAMLAGTRIPTPAAIWPSWQRLIAEEKLPGTILVDLHGESPWEKAYCAAAVDGTLAAVLGTHTHDPTLRCHRLPSGTGYVAEVGMTGRLGHTGGGFDPTHLVAGLRGEPPDGLPPFELSTGSFAMGAVLITTDRDRPNTVRTIDRIS